MEMMGFSKKLTLDHPAVPTIHLQGYLDKSWSERLSGMSIQPSKDENETPITTTSGELLGQAALMGALNCVPNLELPLLSLECIEGNPGG